MDKNKDTMFIDMKYIILYRKLGYNEIAEDVFEYQYFDATITIESEKQRYNYLGKYYDLYNYKDFVMLECIDRLLKKGYHSSNIVPVKGEYDLLINNGERTIVKIAVAQWGKDYDKLLSDFSYSNGIVCLYTSQLSGGLVDYITKIYTQDEIFDKGIFETNIKTYEFLFNKIVQKNSYSADFHVVDNELIKYLGRNKKVIVPNGIRRIGVGAFWNCMFLEEVILPESTTCICGDAFVYCEKLKKANIPSKVNEIGDDPWAGCKEIIIDNKSPYFIVENGVVFDITKKFLIHYPPNSIESKYVIPESVEWIGKHSFYNCQYLEEVVITKNVKFMGNNPFSDCKRIRLVNHSPYFNYIDGVLYNKSKTTAIHFSMGSNIKEVILAETTRTIGRNCFWNCTMIEKIVIPSSVRQIGYNPFANCSNILIENFSENYKVVDGILYDKTVSELICCPSSAVKNGMVIIPTSVINIGRNSFTGCNDLKHIIIHENVKYLSRGAFSGCIKLIKIVIPKTIESIGDWCFKDCLSLKKIRIPKNIKLPPNVFNNCHIKLERY